MYPDEPGRVQGPQERGDPQWMEVLNLTEKPDRISSQDGIVWGFVKSYQVYTHNCYFISYLNLSSWCQQGRRTEALLLICVFNLLDSAKLPEALVVALWPCGACSEVVRSRQQTHLWNHYSAISLDRYPDEPGQVQGPQARGDPQCMEV